MHWLLWSLLAMILWGLWAFYSRVTAVKESLAAYFFTGLICHSLMILYLWKQSPIKFDTSLIPPLLAQACTTLASLFYLLAMKHTTRGGVVLSIISLYVVIGVVLYWLLMHESLHPLEILGILLGIAAIVLLSIVR